jgi:hypothetical protein
MYGLFNICAFCYSKAVLLYSNKSFIVLLDLTSSKTFHPPWQQCSGSMTFLEWIRIRIRGSTPLTMDPNPAFYVIDLQDANKKQFLFKHFFCLLLFEGTFT